MTKRTKRNLKTVSLFIVIAFIFILNTSFVKAASNKGQPLELVYPEIPGVAVTPKTVSVPLPDYVNYIFHLAIAIVGFIIFGVIVSQGVKYLYSVGNPEKFKEARNRIFSAFLGAIILLSTYLIFNTINPQLINSKLPEPPALEPIVDPGIYLCDYNAGQNVASIIDNYVYGNLNTAIKAAKKLKKIMNKEENKEGYCFKVESSGNFKNFAFHLNDNTFFIVPKKIHKEGGGIVARYDYGMIFHEKNNQKGKCRLVSIYGKNISDIGNSDFMKSRSITIFRKPEGQDTEGRGVTLSNCLSGYNKKEMLCPKGVKTSNQFSIKPKGDIIKEDESSLKDVGMVYLPDEPKTGTRAIEIDPEDYYFAILFPKDGFQGNCEVIIKSDPNLLDQDIGRCGPGCHWYIQMIPIIGLLSRCEPCLSSMVVIKGKIIQ